MQVVKKILKKESKGTINVTKFNKEVNIKHSVSDFVKKFSSLEEDSDDDEEDFWGID